MFSTDAILYLKERILKPRIGLLWLLLLACTTPVADVGWASLIPTTALFILAFRLWDDLADCEYDRARYPDRVQARATDLRPFHAARWALLAVLLFELAEKTQAVAFLALVAALQATYWLTDGRPALRLLRTALVLAKYPLFVLLMARHPGEPLTLVAAAAAYLPPLIDETRSSGATVLLPAAILSVLVLLVWRTLLN